MSVRTRLGMFGACAVAAMGLTVGMAGPASAANVSIQVFSASGLLLGNGGFTVGADGGTVWAEDNYCDGDNGIIVEASVRRDGVYRVSGLASVRGCGSINRNNLADNNPRPVWGEEMRIRACGITADGTWKHCRTTYTTNN
ncbi:hypothetical protein [Actinomadura alba]|uniref:Uncharacterized protein n=1 Tax=Actinomadura alba TaxID=406431 RepID=A0ABR7M2C3_9ACTN|nr:hypothetical protein [Actinomadura alba]MBC6471063.1 hypothetical protein [Actinomadura alba]